MSARAIPILETICYREGRGPELQAVRYASAGVGIRAVEYFNPDDVFSPQNIKHLRFIGPQVFMFTPEEVFNPSSQTRTETVSSAAVLCRGKSEWLLSFSQRHLVQCQHFQVTFYDQYLDIICEEIVYGQGVYQPAA